MDTNAHVHASVRAGMPVDQGRGGETVLTDRAGEWEWKDWGHSGGVGGLRSETQAGEGISYSAQHMAAYWLDSDGV